MNLVYLTTAYSFNPDKGYQNAVDLLALCMRDFHGRKLFLSPIAHTHASVEVVEFPRGYEGFWKKVDRGLIEKCDELWVLMDEDGAWETSVGAKDEIPYAKELGYEVKYVRVIYKEGIPEMLSFSED